MSLDNFINFIFLIMAISLAAYIYFRYYVSADEGEKVFIRIIATIGSVFWFVDTIFEKVVHLWD